MFFTKTNGTPVGDISTYIEKWLDANHGQEVFIGTDSRQRGKHTHYVTVVVLHKKNRGGHVLLAQEVHPRKTVLMNRLWHEVSLTYDVAGEVLKGVKGLTPENLQVHLDINPDPIHASNVVYKAALGYVKSLGLPDANILAKPDAAAASFAADNFLLPARTIEFGEATVSG